MPLAPPIQVRLERQLLSEIRISALAKGRSISDEVRHRLSDRPIQELRAELAVLGSHRAGSGSDDLILDALQRLLGMNAEMLGAMRRHNAVNTENARADVERAGLPVWGRRRVER